LFVDIDLELVCHGRRQCYGCPFGCDVTLRSLKVDLKCTRIA
jgi:hypothetical protein